MDLVKITRTNLCPFKIYLFHGSPTLALCPIDLLVAFSDDPAMKKLPMVLFLMGFIILNEGHSQDIRDGLKRARDKCLEGSVSSRFRPRFSKVNKINSYSPIETFLTHNLVGAGVKTKNLRKNGKIVFDDFISEIVHYSNEFDSYQKSCLAQCISMNFFNNRGKGKRRSWFLDDSSSLEKSKGVCYESTLLFKFLGRKLGLSTDSGYNGPILSRLLGVGEHSFAYVIIDGRYFLLNANWGSDQCNFRFSKNWLSHMPYTKKMNRSYKKRYIKEVSSQLRGH